MKEYLTYSRKQVELQVFLIREVTKSGAIVFKAEKRKEKKNCEP